MMMAGLDGIQNKIHPGDAADKDLYDLEPEEAKHIPTVCHSLDMALEHLDKDREFLTRGGVFTNDVIDCLHQPQDAGSHAVPHVHAPRRDRHVLQLLRDDGKRVNPGINFSRAAPGFNGDSRWNANPVRVAARSAPKRRQRWSDVTHPATSFCRMHRAGLSSLPMRTPTVTLLPLAALWLVSATAAATTVYKWVDETGVTHYSDQPHPLAQKVEVQSAQSFQSASPAAATTGSSASRAASARTYSLCELYRPEQDEVFLNTTTLTVKLRVEPRLATGDQVAVALDGQRLHEPAHHRHRVRAHGSGARHAQLVHCDRGRAGERALHDARGHVPCSPAVEAGAGEGGSTQVLIPGLRAGFSGDSRKALRPVCAAARGAPNEAAMAVEFSLPSALSHFEPAELFDALSTGIIVLDAQLCPIYANVAAQNLLAFSLNQARGRPFGDFLHDASGLVSILRRALETAQGISRSRAHGAAQSAPARSARARCDHDAARRAGHRHASSARARRRHAARSRISRENDLFARLDSSRMMVRQLAHEIKNPLGRVARRRAAARARARGPVSARNTPASSSARPIV